MSATRVIRYVLGVIFGALTLAFALPFAGIPSSHFLPPNHVWQKAQGVGKGILTSKYYAVTQNPFHVGDRQYFVNYEFYAPPPLPGGLPGTGKPVLYYGTVRLHDQGVYKNVAIVHGTDLDDVKANVKVPTYSIPVRVRYEKNFPDINGIDAEWGGRSIGPCSNILSGWLLWVLAAFVLGYFYMLLFERFGAKENI